MLASGEWNGNQDYSGFEVDLPAPRPEYGQQPIQAFPLADGRFVVLVTAGVMPNGGDVMGKHQFMVVVQADGSDAQILELPEDTAIAAAAPGGSGDFVTCDNLRIQEWDAQGQSLGEHNLASQLYKKHEVRKCHGLAWGADGMLRVLVRVTRDSSPFETTEVLVVNSLWSVASSYEIPVAAASNGMRLRSDGGFLVFGAVDSGVAGLVMSDPDGHFTCW